MSAAPTVACAATCLLGEGTVWDHRIGRLHYVDILGKAVITFDPATGITTRVPTAEMIGFVALTADPGVVVGGLRGGLHLIELATAKATLLSPVEAERPSIRINDGTVAPDGAIVFGTMETVERTSVGTFWRWHRGALSPLGGRMIVTNGPAFAPDGETVLTVDSIARTIHRHRYTGGTFGPATLFATIPENAGVPDGLAFDVEGHAWVCHFGGARVTRFHPDGSVADVIRLPASQITKCAFAGPDMRTLYISSAARGLSLATEPEAGCLFAAQLTVAGPPATIAAL